MEGGRESQGHWRELTDGWIMGNLKAFGACDQRKKRFQEAAVELQTGDGVDREALSVEPGRAVPSLDLRQEHLHIDVALWRRG